MNHLVNTNKMVSDTPRTDRWLKNINGWHYVEIERSRELERELNAANTIIRQQQLLDEENLRLTERIKRLNDRIKELEAKVDELHDLEKWLEGR